MNRWLFRGIIVAVGVIVTALPLTVDLAESKVTTTKAACSNCRPATDDWMCAGRWGSCPLWYKGCRDLPLF